MPLLCAGSGGQCRTRPPGQQSLSRLSEPSALLCSYVDGLAFLPGEFKPDCQRIPAEMEVSANVKFSQDKGQLGGLQWEERGEDVSDGAWSHFIAATRWAWPGPLAPQPGPLLPGHALAVYFNSRLQLSIDHNASLHNTSWNENSAVTSKKFYDRPLQRNWSNRDSRARKTDDL